jgi:CheY-like chemotaxis protein
MNPHVLAPAPLHKGSCIQKSFRPAEPMSALRILVAEDDPVICRLIAGVLADNNFVVNMAFNGEQAWEALNLNQYDLLVTDNEMPQLTGLELIRRIRKAGMSLPAIVTSGSFSVESARKYPQLKISAVIPKPFWKSEFLDAVRDALSASQVAAA